MIELPIECQFSPTIPHDYDSNCKKVSVKLNPEWTLVCLWSQSRLTVLESLEIIRSSSDNDILLSGSFKLMYAGACLLQKNLLASIRAGFENIIIPLNEEYKLSNHVAFFGANYSITGTLFIEPDKVARKEHPEGVQFESLLELSRNFECLMVPGATYFSDVILKCGAASLPAHKNILSARSPVFAAMFKSQMKESRNDKVDITDISLQVLKTMLTHMYTGKTGELSVQSAEELLFAADKYELRDLKKVCCDYLKRYVSAENVLSTLVLGYLHDQSLKAFAMDFICKSNENFEVMEKTEEWEKMRKERQDLAIDVLTSLVKYKDHKLKGCK